jgi:hypothetical protein
VRFCELGKNAGSGRGHYVMKKTQLEAKLARIAKDLDAVAGRLEDTGFYSQRDLLDKAADAVEEVQEAFAAL